MAISTRWSRSPVTRPDQSPSIMLRPSSSRPSSAKKEIAASSDSTTMPTLSILCSATRPFLRIANRSPPGGRDGQPERLPTGHEDVLTAVVVERLPGESAVERLEAQPRDVEEAQPFVLGRPPERTGSAIVQGDVDSVVADAVVVRVRHRYPGVGVGAPAV